MSKILTLKGDQVDVGGAPEIISVLPMGHVISQKGEFDVDESSLESMKRQIAQRGVDLVVDYEHQTLSGERAPAAGWVKELLLEDGQIKARVEWTPPARQYLENKEYRYLSPVVNVRESDRKVTGLHSLALTNTPAIEGMAPIVNSLTFEGGNTNMEELIKKLAELFGMGEDTTEEQLTEQLKACLAENKALKAGGQEPSAEAAVIANKAVCELLGLKAGAPTADVSAKIMELKGGAGLAEEVKSLKAKLADREADEAVTLALKAGKISPAQRDWAKGYALADPKGFEAFVAVAPQAVPMGEFLPDDSTVSLKRDTLDEATILACKLAGVSLEEVAKYNTKKEG